MPSVSIKGRQVQLRTPVSVTSQWETIGILEEFPLRAAGAALGLCAPQVTKARFKGDIREFGGAVVDDLNARGVSITEIREAGQIALGMIAEGLTAAAQEAGVQAAEDFSAPVEPTST